MGKSTRDILRNTTMRKAAIKRSATAAEPANMIREPAMRTALFAISFMTWIV